MQDLYHQQYQPNSQKSTASLDVFFMESTADLGADTGKSRPAAPCGAKGKKCQRTQELRGLSSRGLRESKGFGFFECFGCGSGLQQRD